MIYIGYIKFTIFIGTFYELRLGRGDRKSAIIIFWRQILILLVWCEIPSKILRFLGKPTNPALRRFTTQGKSSFEVACKQSWLDLAHQDKPESTNLFLSCCLVGTTNDPFKSSPKSEVI